MENSLKREEKKGRNGKENSGPSGGAQWLKPPPQFLLQPLHNFCVK